MVLLLLVTVSAGFPMGTVAPLWASAFPAAKQGETGSADVPGWINAPAI